jgi:hypothetical protein
MTQKTNTTSEYSETSATEQLLVASPLSHDVKNAVLIVSLIINLIIFTTWIAMQVTSQYDGQVASLLFT